MKSLMLICSLLLIASGPAKTQTRCIQNDSIITIYHDGKHALTYQKTVNIPAGVDSTWGRSGFIHPITTPSGKVITDGYPLPHHMHQNGLYTAWKKATYKGEKMDFWMKGKESIMHERVLEIINNEESAGFRVELAHMSGKKKILSEIWRVVLDAESGLIDFKSKQSCATEFPVTIEQYKYGGMAIRGSRQWFKDAHTSAGEGAVKDEYVEPCKIITNQGLTQENGNHSRPEWVCMTGNIDGAPVSITLIPHPDNFRYPQQVRIHPDMPYFCFHPAVENSFNIEPGKPLVSRFRIVVDDGRPDKKALIEIQKQYANED